MMSINFRKIFQDFKINVRDEGKEWVNANCPFCTNPPDSHFNGGFDCLSPRFNCWRCGSHSWYDALSKILGLPLNQISQLAKSYTFFSPEAGKKKTAQATHIDLPGFRLNEAEREYLMQRGFNPDYLTNKYHIRGGGIAGDWSYRIIIPVYYNRVLVSWTGRSVLSKEFIKEHNIPRYKNLSIEQSVINPKEIFFNLDHSMKEQVMLVEGPFDVIRMGDNCICSLGTSMTREQELFLKNRYKKIFICFDNEPSAQKKARKVGTNLAAIGMNVEVVNICEPFGKNDPGELTEEETRIIWKELEF